MDEGTCQFSVPDINFVNNGTSDFENRENCPLVRQMTSPLSLPDFSPPPSPVLGDICGPGAVQVGSRELCTLGHHHTLRGDDQKVSLSLCLSRVLVLIAFHNLLLCSECVHDVRVLLLLCSLLSRLPYKVFSQRLGKGNFNIARSILDLIYTQALLW